MVPTLFSDDRGRGRAPSSSIPGVTDDVDPRPLNVMIVEDEVFVALHLEAMVESLGHTVAIIASNGQAALDAVAEAEPDLILLDVNLGDGLSGVDVAERLEGRGVRIVFVTAYADAENRARMTAAAPACRILSKPVETHSLRRALDDVDGAVH